MKMNSMNRLRAIVWVGISIALLNGVAFAQLPTASITGAVHDSSQAAIPGATVTAISDETGLTRTIQTDPDGRYVLLALPIGVYDVKAEAASFSTMVQQRLTLTVSQEAVINFTLTVGTVQQGVTVEATAPLVETTNGTLGGLVGEERVADLPLNGRNFTDLTLMQTGISIQRASNTTAPIGATGMLFSSNGAGIRSNYMSLDGASMVSAQGYNSSSIISTQLGVEGIREFLVVTNSMKAEYGMVMGSQTIIATKGGTNQFHGTAFEYFRNSALDARNFFDPAKIPVFHRNNFGGSFGGPIKKNKLFFFGTYEGIRQNQGITTPLNVPTHAAKQPGFFASLPGGPVASVLPYLAQYPDATGFLASDPTGAKGIGTYTSVFATPSSEDYIQGRVDGNISDKDSLFGRYTIDNSSQTNQTNRFPGFPTLLSGRSQFVTIAENHIFSTSLLNTFRVSFSRPFLNFQSPSDTALGFAPGIGEGDIAVTGLTQIGPNTTYPYIMRHNLFTFSDDLSWSHGAHTLKFGTLVNHYESKSYNASPGRGTYTFSSLGTCTTPTTSCFLGGVPQQLNIMNPSSNLPRDFKWDTIGFYAQDDWRVNSRLILNLGLRYEISTTVNEETGHGWSMRNLATDSLATINFTPPLYVNPTLRNFGPRFGFAWDVFGDSKTSVRGGFAYLYDITTIIGGAQNGASANPPFSGVNNILSGFTFPNTPIPSLALSNTLRAIEWKLGQPHMLQYNLTLERSLPGNTVVSLAYAGSRGLNLLQTREGNPTIPTMVNGQMTWSGTVPSCATPGPNPRINCNFQTIELRSASGDSWYSSLQASVQKRLSHGLQFQGSYTWAHCLDDSQGIIGGEAGGSKGSGNNPLNNAYDKGNCDFDIRQSLVFNALYVLPSPTGSEWAKSLLGGWRLGTIVTLKTGQPFTVYDSGNASRSLTGTYTGLNADRTNVVVPCDPIVGKPNPNRYYNPACFAPQIQGYLGNQGRNQYFGPGFANWDFSVTKDTPLHRLGEAGSLQFRAEVFNITNHPNFFNPNNTLFTYTNTTVTTAGVAPTLLPNSNAGQITQTSNQSREIQFALKLIF